METIAAFFSRLFGGRGRRLEKKIDLLLLMQEQGQRNTMAALDDLISAINDETNAVASLIDGLNAQLAAALAAGTAPTADQLASLQAISDRLKALGANPAQPVPPAPAPVVTP